MVVSITSTVNLVFGSRIMDTVTGILFNNEVRGIVLHNAIQCQRINIFSRWMIFQYQEFRMHSVSGLHRVCTQIVYNVKRMLISHR